MHILPHHTDTPTNKINIQRCISFKKLPKTVIPANGVRFIM